MSKDKHNPDTVILISLKLNTNYHRGNEGQDNHRNDAIVVRVISTTTSSAHDLRCSCWAFSAGVLRCVAPAKMRERSYKFYVLGASPFVETGGEETQITRPDLTIPKFVDSDRHQVYSQAKFNDFNKELCDVCREFESKQQWGRRHLSGRLQSTCPTCAFCAGPIS